VSGENRLGPCAEASYRRQPRGRSSRRSTHGLRRCPRHRRFGTLSDAAAASLWPTASTSGAETTDPGEHHSSSDSGRGGPSASQLHDAWRAGKPPGHLRDRDLPTERAHGDDSRSDAGDLASRARDRWPDPTAGEAELRGALVPLRVRVKSEGFQQLKARGPNIRGLAGVTVAARRATPLCDSPDAARVSTRWTPASRSRARPRRVVWYYPSLRRV